MTRGPSKQFDTEIALSKAMDVFWEHGYEAASLSQLLKQMGIGKKSLYDTFGNKQSLFLKALEHYAHTTLRDIRKRLSAEGSALNNIKQLLLDWQTMHGRPGSCGCMLGTNIADFNTDDEAIAKVMRGYLCQLEDTFSNALIRAQKAGELSPNKNPRDLARLLLCTTQGIALLGRVMEDDTTLKGAVQSALLLLEEEPPSH
ncbi:TetR/AcrR family transcriptional regulator [Leptolyngbyaceae cyanobacterium CCMR0082]|uniref:TetR/AcrR family transcriptional regulator n=1 Tax=Adonisia turfae CCMR0082 TaxID=2304604 RepID=A0A6M0S7G6_9CYAN|nr:TetR/AcrR family transcriptional regulator [Adonisia turfae]NEZ64405.1 TetR/AcrR family transcriptional regulator [Adonisia turfae CCMR0082]